MKTLENNEREMIFEFMSEMNLSQLQKLSHYAAKIWSDRRYKHEKENHIHKN